jgi:hypothetical protein
MPAELFQVNPMFVRKFLLASLSFEAAAISEGQTRFWLRTTGRLQATLSGFTVRSILPPALRSAMRRS